MVATQFTRAERRAIRWMRRRGLGLHPSEAAFAILVARLAVRFRAGLTVWPVFGAAFLAWQFGLAPGRPTDGSWGSVVGHAVVPVAAVGLICAMVFAIVLRRPTVALDTGALAIDERLRALDASYALWPIGWVGIALTDVIDLRGVPGSGLVPILASAALIASFSIPFSHPTERVRYGLDRSGGHA